MNRRAAATQARASASAATGGLRFGTTRVAFAVALPALAGLAWVAAARRMTGMDAGPGTDPGALGFYLATWILMMTAMMLPSLTPAALSHAGLVRASAGRRPRTGAAALFVAGYLALWGVPGLVGYAVLEAGRSVDGGLLAWHRAGRWAAAGVLLIAAGYQLTPAKAACLSRCRQARASLGERLDEDRLGGLRLGARHGAWCIGCCWGLIAALFALGAMSVAWMVVVSLLIATERLLPSRRLGAIGPAAVLAALSIGLAAAPSRVPLLTIPRSPAATAATGTSATRRPSPGDESTGMSPTDGAAMTHRPPPRASRQRRAAGQTSMAWPSPTATTRPLAARTRSSASGTGS